jgi:hypothetical protein
MSQNMNSDNDNSDMDINDYLDVDDPINGQNYVCLSFLSPENWIEKKQLYVFDKFRHSYFKRHRMLMEKIRKEITDAKLLASLDEMADIYEMYEIFRINEMEKCEKMFDEENGHKNSVRGVKVGGVYNTIDEARARSKKLHKKNPLFHVFIGQVGYWLPFDPDSSRIDDQQYANEQLNQLMKEYRENQKAQKEMWEKDKMERLEKMRAELSSSSASSSSS